MFKWISRVAVIVTVATTAILSLANRNDANAVPFVVGTLDGAGGGIVANLVANAQASLDISVLQSSTLDATFFNQIDVFLFVNGQGNTSLTLGPTVRTNLLNFVTGGGHAYMGLDAISGVGPPFDNDGAAIANLFGFDITNRAAITETGSITVATHQIATGPFQPASAFTASFFGEVSITGDPTGRSIIGSTLSKDVFAFLDADILGVGSGKVYISSDEVPVGTALDGENLFKNALFDMGAMFPARVPEPGTLALFGIGLLGLGCMMRRHRAT